MSETLVGGVFTNICVSSAVLGLTSRQYGVTVLSDCTAASSIGTHESAIETLEIITDGLQSSTDAELEPTSI